MTRFKRILSLILITLPVLGSSIALFVSIYTRDIDNGWQDIEEKANIIQEEVQTKFNDEIMKLRLMETIFLQSDERRESADRAVEIVNEGQLYLSTVFSRIHVVYADREISISSADTVSSGIGFEEAFARGEGMTERYEDAATGKQCVSYILPVRRDGEACFAVVGVVDLEKLSTFFSPKTYGEDIHICIIDARDGNYVMDSWHSDLGNAYAMEERERCRGYEDVDFRADLYGLKSGQIMFDSKITGKPLCMYYTPAEVFDWEIAVFVPGNILFADAHQAARRMALVGGFNTLFIALYFLWNINMVNKLEKSNLEIEKQRRHLSHLTYRDALTSIYNRRRFTDNLDRLERQLAFGVGVVYMDLNGLKAINDLRSHETGDAYLRTASEVILAIFGKNSYRIGGDEFIVLEEDMPEDELNRRVELLHQRMKERGVDVSVGVAWRSETYGISEMVSEAEKRMYVEKANYYQLHGRDKVPDFGSDAENACGC